MARRQPINFFFDNPIVRSAMEGLGRIGARTLAGAADAALEAVEEKVDDVSARVRRGRSVAQKHMRRRIKVDATVAEKPANDNVIDAEFVVDDDRKR